MKTKTSILFGCALGASLAGCYYERTKPPSDWSTVMDAKAAVARDISGLYGNSGDRFRKEGGGAILSASLSAVLNEIMGDSGFCPAAKQIQFRQIGSNQLEITARNDAEVVATKTIAIETEHAAVFLTGNTREIEGRKLLKGPMVIGTDARLFKGADGFLYVEKKHHASGKIKGVIPFGGGGNEWARFPPDASASTQIPATPQSSRS